MITDAPPKKEHVKPGVDPAARRPGEKQDGHPPVIRFFCLFLAPTAMLCHPAIRISIIGSIIIIGRRPGHGDMA